MAGVLTLSLGGQSYAVRPLTLRQLRDLGVGIQKGRDGLQASHAEREAAAYDSMIDTVLVALRRDKPELTADTLLDLEISLDELQAARNAILAFSGLVPQGEAAAAPSGGPTSTAS